MDRPPGSAYILIGIKLLHTTVWIFMVACIAGIPLAAASGRFRAAGAFILIVLIECAVLAVNHGRCPLTNLAAHFTAARSANFDIYLPVWLARHNKAIFGSLYIAGLAFAAICWSLSQR